MTSAWHNWAGDQTCRPVRIERPAGVDEVVAAVRRAADEGRRVRVAGAGHSFGDNVVTPDVLMSLDVLSGLLDVDRSTGLVRVAAGTRIRELSPLLEAQGLAMPNLGDVDAQSLGGAIATATHGTGRTLGNLATQVAALQLVTADGAVRELDADGETSDLLPAARVSVGALGVVTACTLRTVPAFRLHGLQEPRPLDETLARLDEDVDRHDHFEFFVFPHTDVAIVKATDRTDEPALTGGRLAGYLKGPVLENAGLGLLCRLGRARPRSIPALNRLTARLATPTVKRDRSWRVFASPRSVRFTETEWALPREACEPVVREILGAVTARGFDVNFPLEVRFVAADTDSYLSPSYDRETCYVAAHTYRGMDWRPYFDAVQEIALAHDGRPHWGKRHTLDAAALAKRYPEWERFQDAREALDPDGRFANDHVRRVFGDARAHR